MAFDPQKMIALKTTGYPEGSPYAEIGKGMWSVFYFDEAGPDAVTLTVVGLGYDDSEASQQMRKFFAAANEHAINGLKAALGE